MEIGTCMTSSLSFEGGGGDGASKGGRDGEREGRSTERETGWSGTRLLVADNSTINAGAAA